MAKRIVGFATWTALALCALGAALCVCLASGQAVVAMADEGGAFAGGNLDVGTQAAAKMYGQTYWLGQEYPGVVYIENFPSDGKVTKVISSKSKVLKAKRGGTKPYQCTLTPVGIGKSTVTVTYTTGGKTKKVSAVYQVKAYPTPFKSIKVNGKAVKVPSSKNTKTLVDLLGFTGTKAKVNVAAASGWKVTYLSASTYTPGKNDYKYFAVKDGKSFSVPKGKEATININAMNSSGNYFNYTVRVCRAGGMTLQPATLWLGQSTSPQWNFSTDPSNIKITKVASANKGVLTAKKTGSKYYQITLTAKKAGKSKLTVTYKVNGSTYTTSAIYTVKKFPKPIASLTVGGAKVNLNAHKYSYFNDNYKKSTAKLTLKPSSGWSVKSILHFSMKSVGTSVVPTRISNGSTVKVPAKSTCQFSIELADRSGATFNYIIVLNRK